MEQRGRRDATPGDEEERAPSSVPRVDVDTVRPPGEGGGDAYSAETVVRAVPKELLADIHAILKPSKVPAIKIPEPEVREAEETEPEPPKSELGEGIPAVSTRLVDEDPPSVVAAELAKPEPDLRKVKEEPAPEVTEPAKKEESTSIALWLGVAALIIVLFIVVASRM